MMKSSIECKEVMSHICESLGEDFNSPACSAIKAHLSECNGCSNYFKTVSQTIDFYKEYNLDIPQEAHKRLIKFLGINDAE